MKTIYFFSALMLSPLFLSAADNQLADLHVDAAAPYPMVNLRCFERDGKFISSSYDNLNDPDVFVLPVSIPLSVIPGADTTPVGEEGGLVRPARKRVGINVVYETITSELLKNNKPSTVPAFKQHYRGWWADSTIHLFDPFRMWANSIERDIRDKKTPKENHIDNPDYQRCLHLKAAIDVREQAILNGLLAHSGYKARLNIPHGHMTPFLYACNEGWIPGIQIMLKNGASTGVNLDSGGRTVMDEIARSGQSIPLDIILKFAHNDRKTDTENSENKQKLFTTKAWRTAELRKEPDVLRCIATHFPDIEYNDLFNFLAKRQMDA